MAVLPSSPSAVALGQVNIALGNVVNATISLGSPQVRDLYGVASGQISLAGQGWGICAFTITGSNINLYNSAIAAGWNGTSRVVATCASNITSTSTGTPAIYIAGFPSSVYVNINGYTVAGCGGTGGSSCGQTVTASTDGGVGGTAIVVASNNNGVTIFNNGTVGGGGGGGGGGGSNYAAAGGGGRAGGTVATTGASGGGGGGGAGNGAFGTAYTAPGTGSNGNAGGLTTGGSGGTGGVSGIYTGGDGGTGGSLGVSGGSGTGGVSGNIIIPAGAGGSGGAAIVGSVYTTRTGSGSWLGAIG